MHFTPLFGILFQEASTIKCSLLRLLLMFQRFKNLRDFLCVFLNAGQYTMQRSRLTSFTLPFFSLRVCIHFPFPPPCLPPPPSLKRKRSGPYTVLGGKRERERIVGGLCSLRVCRGLFLSPQTISPSLLPSGRKRASSCSCRAGSVPPSRVCSVLP